MQRVLVAGATGYLGRFMVRALKRNGYGVKALVRSEASLNAAGPFDSPAIAEWIDEAAVADITKKETLQGICTGVDYVFSSIGITRQKDKLTFREVDYLGNLHLLREAERAGVKRFMYMNVHGAETCASAMIQAKQAFVEELIRSDVSHILVNPTGYYSDMTVWVDMARSGKIFLLGQGENKMNPIHGSDLAEFCVSSWKEANAALAVGGPRVYTYREMGELALDLANRKGRVYSLPLWLMKAALPLMKAINRRQYELFQFFFHVMTHDVVARPYGQVELASYFEQVQAGPK